MIPNYERNRAKFIKEAILYKVFLQNKSIETFYSKLDWSQNGSVTKIEFGNGVLRNLNVSPQEYGKWVDSLFDEIESQRNEGRIEQAEFVREIEIANQTKSLKVMILLQNRGMGLLEIYQKIKGNSSELLVDKFVNYVSKLFPEKDLEAIHELADDLMTDDERIEKEGFCDGFKLISTLTAYVESISQYKTSLVRFINSAFTEEKDPFQIVFNKFDESKSGTLSFEELYTGLANYCGVKKTPSTEIIIRDLFVGMDYDGTTSVDEAEFKSYLNDKEGLERLYQEILIKYPYTEDLWKAIASEKVRITYEEFVKGYNKINIVRSELLMRKMFNEICGRNLASLETFSISKEDFYTVVEEKRKLYQKDINPEKVQLYTPQGPKWSIHKDPFGITFYFNHETGKSDWYKPKELQEDGEKTCSWKEFKTDANITYFYNRKTKESTWIMPERYRKFKKYYFKKFGKECR